MQTLKDIKDALKDIPDEILDNLFFGSGEGSEETIQLVAGEGVGEFEYPAVFDIIDKKYPKINELNNLIKNIVKAQKKLDKSDGDEDYFEIDSEDKY